MKLEISRIVSIVFVLFAFAHTGLGQDRVGPVKVGSKVTFIATADGSPAPTFLWYKNGVPIPGATSHVFVIPVVLLEDAGVYKVEARNVAGSAESNPETLIVLSVKPKEAIDTHEVLTLWQALRKDFAIASLPKCLKSGKSIGGV